MPNTVWYSTSPYGTGDIKTGTPNISITSGVATLTVAQTGNIGCGCCIEYNSLKAYIAPNRIGFDSGGTVEIKPGDKIQGGTSSATGIVRAVELTSGSWSGGDAAGYIYFETTSGIWQNDEQINRTKPSSSTDLGTTDGTLEGNLGSTNTQFVVKTATGGTPSNQSSTSVTSIHHEYASLSALEAGFTDSNHINNTDLTSSGADVIVFACCYYDHDDQTADTTAVTIDFGTTDSTHWFQVFTPTGGAESINSQRHDGKWNNNKYKLEISGTSNSITVLENYIRIGGLQCNTLRPYSGYVEDIKLTLGSGNAEIQVFYTIIKKNQYDDNDPYSKCISGQYVSGTNAFTLKIWNCLFYNGYTTGHGSGINIRDLDWTLYSYNNTAVNLAYGFYRQDGTFIIKNCLTQSCTDGFYGTFDSSSDYNCSDISGDAPGSNSVTGTVSFVDAANDDYHLSSSDTVAKDAGTDLSSDSDLPIWRDIDGDDRVGGTWDIGADEYVSTGAILNSSADIQSATITPDSILKILREVSATITSQTNTTTPSLEILREIIANVQSQTDTNDSVALELLKTATANILASSITTSVLLKILRTAIANTPTSTSTSATVLAILRQLIADIQTQTLTSDSVELSIGNIITAIANILSQTDTSQSILSVLHELTSAINSQTYASDSVELSIAGIIEAVANILSQTQTSISGLDVLRLSSANIQSQTDTPSVILAILHSLIANIQAATETSTANLVIIKIGQATITTTSITADAALRILRIFSSSIQSNTLVSDTSLDILRLSLADIDAVTLTSAINLITEGLGIIIDTTITSLTTSRTITSLTTTRTITSLTTSRTIEEI